MYNISSIWSTRYIDDMKLNDYRLQKNWSYGQLAMMIGASHATVVRRWCLPLTHKNSMIPDKKFMLQIVKLTNGEVQPNDFYFE